MLGLFNGVQKYVVPKPKKDVPRPDNMVARLHYRFTFTVLMVSTIMVTASGFIDSKGSFIQCMIDKGLKISTDVINRYCWVMSTFTLPDYFEGAKGDKFPEFGIGPYNPEDPMVYHAYYQWVPFVLFFQALCFYFPHFVWKQLEGGRMRHIVNGLNVHLTSPDTRKNKVEDVFAYLEKRLQTKEHSHWAFKYFIAEVLNFVNVISQIYFTDRFLGGEFTKYGLEVMNFPWVDAEKRVDPMSKVFPKVTKCTFHRYGGSGTIQNHDAMCVLGMNIVNEKIYIFLWFWFIVLAVVTGINLILRIIQMAIPSVRKRCVAFETKGLLEGKTKATKDAIERVVSKLHYGDWMIVYYMSQCMDNKNFVELINRLDEGLPENPYSQYRAEDDERDGENPAFTDSPDGTWRSNAGSIKKRVQGWVR